MSVNRSGQHAEEVAVGSLDPGTVLIVHTRNSQYRFLVLFDRHVVLVSGGSMFPEAALVRLNAGWIRIDNHIEMWRGPVRIRTSRVCSVALYSGMAGV